MNRRTCILTVLLLTAFAGFASACPMCKDSIPNSDVTNPVTVGGGFNASVYIMLGTFLSMLALITGVIYKGVADSNRFNDLEKHRAEKKRLEAEAKARQNDQNPLA